VPVQSVNIPFSVVALGLHSFGPFVLAPSDADFKLSVDRTVTQGLNSLTTASTILVAMEMSTDGGVSWFYIGGTTMTGGIRSDPEDGQLNEDRFSLSLQQVGEEDRQVRANITVGGPGGIGVAGSLTVT
jgi:hypothetical protein